MNGLALCAGYGGLELGIERVFDEFKTVCYVEGEAFAAQHLVKKMEEGSLDDAPIWSNVKTFDGKPWSGKVDWISGGFPCQPYSTAGKALGENDPRDLWPDFVRIIGEVRPGIIFLENVPNIVKLRLDQIVIDLDRLGYHAAWCVLAASEVGAPHERKRWFCMAIKSTDPNSKCIRWNENQQPSSERKSNIERVRGEVAHTNDQGMGPCIRRTDKASIENGSKRKIDVAGGSINAEPQENRESPNLQGNVPDSNQFRTPLPHHREHTTIKMPCSEGKKGRIDISEGFYDQWKTEPGMDRLVDGASDWVDKLRLLGNGVVPQQAAYAFQILGDRLAAGIVENRTPKL